MLTQPPEFLDVQPLNYCMTQRRERARTDAGRNTSPLNRESLRRTTIDLGRGWPLCAILELACSDYPNLIKRNTKVPGLNIVSWIKEIGTCLLFFQKILACIFFFGLPDGFAVFTMFLPSSFICIILDMLSSFDLFLIAGLLTNLLENTLTYRLLGSYEPITNPQSSWLTCL